MKQLIFTLLLTLLLATNAYSLPAESQRTDSLWAKANRAYALKQYADAAQDYETLCTIGISPKLYYNLGNSYYKMGEIGLAILNYERALRLAPNMENAKNNLTFAKEKIVDNIDRTPPFFIKKWWENILVALSANQWIYVGVVAFSLALLAFLYFFFCRTYTVKRIWFYITLFFVVVAGVSLSFSVIRTRNFVQHKVAIITTGAVTVKSAPDKSGTDLFQLHEGTKVEIKESLSEWVEIELPNGAIGWVEQQNLDRI